MSSRLEPLSLAEAKRLYGVGWATFTLEEQAAILRGEGLPKVKMTLAEAKCLYGAQWDALPTRQQAAVLRGDELPRVALTLDEAKRRHGEATWRAMTTRERAAILSGDTALTEGVLGARPLPSVTRLVVARQTAPDAIGDIHDPRVRMIVVRRRALAHTRAGGGDHGAARRRSRRRVVLCAVHVTHAHAHACAPWEEGACLTHGATDLIEPSLSRRDETCSRLLRRVTLSRPSSALARLPRSSLRDRPRPPARRASALAPALPRAREDVRLVRGLGPLALGAVWVPRSFRLRAPPRRDRYSLRRRPLLTRRARLLPCLQLQL